MPPWGYSAQSDHLVANWNISPLARHAAALLVVAAGTVVTAATVWLNYGCAAFLEASRCPIGAGRIWAADWLAFWAAGRLAARDAALAYQPLWLNEVTHSLADIHGSAIWAYPPTYFLIVTPLARFSPLVSDVIFQATALLLALLAAWKLGLRGFALCAVAVSPAVVISFCMGQNGALTAALLTAGLWLSPAAPMAGGALLGLAVIKPQIVLLVPVCLVASRNSKALIAASLSAVISAFVATAIFGANPWFAQASLGPTYMLQLMRELPQDRARIAVLSPMESLAASGVPVTTAGAIQLAVTLACAVVAWKAWARKDADPTARLGLTLALGLLATGYCYVYDSVALSVAITLAASRGPRLTPAQGLALSIAWAWPILSGPVQLLLGAPPVGPFVVAAAAWAFHARLAPTLARENVASAAMIS
jgi:hypothetical protein